MINLPIEEISKIKIRINKCCETKINAFSPTISPAPKDVENNEIESIRKGIVYYIQNGITDLVFQKKYMGSYGDIYLTRNLEDSYLVSRNAYIVNRIPKETILESLKELHEKIDWKNEKLALVIIQSEIMPWRSLGSGLVENEFNGYLDAHQTHFNYLKNNGLYEKINQVKESEAFKNYITAKTQNKESELKKMYPPHVIRQYDAIQDFIIKDFDQYSAGIATYRKQINHFGKDEPLYFKPFNILKKVFEDGSESIPNDNASFSTLNNDEMLEIDFSNPLEIENNIEKVYNWYASLTGEMEEGIMIKPKLCFIKNMPPAFKVRNNSYLTMIYGIDFKNDYSRNLQKRKIEAKLDCSIKDWMLNWDLLKIPYQSINGENYHYKNLLLDRIIGEHNENKLDSRL